MPDGPSTITSRASANVSPTNAICPLDRLAKGNSPCAMPETHTAPALVFPEPLPPNICQTRQSPIGGSCASRALISHSFSAANICLCFNPAAQDFPRALLCKFFNSPVYSSKHLTQLADAHRGPDIFIRFLIFSFGNQFTDGLDGPGKRHQSFSFTFVWQLLAINQLA